MFNVLNTTLSALSMKTFTSAIYFLSACLGLTQSTTIGIDVPRSANGNGNSESSVPLTIPEANSARYQQVYAASEFSRIPNGGFISKLFFRPAGDVGVGGIEIQVNLSTTTRQPDSLSTTFADNVGVDDTVVYPRGDFTLLGQPPGGFFSVVMPLQRQFLYDPAQGNLLLDIRVFRGYPRSPGENPVMDVHTVMGDSVSRVWGDLNASTALIADTTGLVTVFEVTPVSEPSAIALLGIGIFCAGVVRKAISRRHKVGQASCLSQTLRRCLIVHFVSPNVFVSVSLKPQRDSNEAQTTSPSFRANT